LRDGKQCWQEILRENLEGGRGRTGEEEVAWGGRGLAARAMGEKGKVKSERYVIRGNATEERSRGKPSRHGSKGKSRPWERGTT